MNDTDPDQTLPEAGAERFALARRYLCLPSRRMMRPLEKASEWVEARSTSRWSVRMRINFSPGRFGLPAAKLFAGILVAGMSISGGALAEEIKVGGTGGALATMRLLANAFQKTHPEAKIVVLPSIGSGGGIKAVLAGAIDVGVSSRPLKPSEIGLGATGVEIGRTPFVFAVRANGGPDNISSEELVAMYSGTRNTWPDGRTIRLVLRPAGDSASELVKSISADVFKVMVQAEKRPGMLFAITDQEAAENIEAIEGAFGTSTLAQILSERRALKPLSLNGVEPTAKNVADGSYRYFKPLLIVTGPKTSPTAQQFVAFMRTTGARAILVQNGHAAR